MPRFVPAALIVLLMTPTLAGCNAITGADGLSISDETEETEQGGPGSGNTHQPGGTGAGAGGVTGGGGQPGTTTSGTNTTPTTSGTSTSTSTSAEPCVYPSGPTGVGLGQVVPQGMTWQGFAENGAQATTVAITDYFDCDGSKGVDALLFITSATWCGACQEEAAELEAHTSGSWSSQGIHVITLMIENASGEAATVATAQQWKDSFGLVTSAVVADPNVSMANSPSFGTPLEVVVDPRTMTVVDRQEGWSTDYPSLVSLAQQNAN